MQDENKYYNQQLHEKYLSNGGSGKYLSASEKAWLTDHGPIRVGYQDNYLAFCASDDATGQLTGALKDYLDYASTSLENGHLIFEATAYPSAGAAMKALKNGEVDCVIISNYRYSNISKQCDNLHLTTVYTGVDMDYSCRVTMIAHGGWFLAQHAEEPDVRFNILYGKYDYVIMQEHAHPFGPEESFRMAAVKLNALIRQAGGKPIIYETWAKKDEPEAQAYMNIVHQHIAQEIGALLAPVGENWWGYMRSWPDLEMYDGDGTHASRAGSDFAAKMIWEEIWHDLQGRKD